MRIAIAAYAVLVALLGVTGYFIFLADEDGDDYAACRQTRIAGGTSALGGPVSLVDETGARVDEDQIFDMPTLLYFGFTYCPDVCPLDAVRNAEAAQLLREKGEDIKLAFITVDPARDTPQVLAEYTSYYDDNMLGLTGSEEDIARAARAFRVYYAKNGEGEDYLMDHSAFSYLVDRTGTVVEVFRREISGAELAEQLQCFVARMS